MAETAMTLEAIEIAIAKHFDFRHNLVVTNLSWGMLNHEADIIVMSKKKYEDVIFDGQGDEDCRWYECRINRLTVDEKTGVDKRTPASYLICAPDLHMALSRFDGYMRGSLADAELTAVIETPILDVFIHDTDNANS